MKKTLVQALLIVLAVNVLAAAAFVAWLGYSGRLSRERVHGVVDTFRLTIDEERRQAEEARRLAEQQAERAMQAQRLEAVADGPQTLQDMLERARLSDDVAMLRLDRLRNETQHLLARLESDKQVIQRMKAELEAERQAFEQRKAAYEQQALDEGFQRTVALLEQLKPKQVRDLFLEMIEQGNTPQVVDYLAAMQKRRAAAALREFKTEEQIVQAKHLLEGLQSRGVDIGADDAILASGT